MCSEAPVSVPDAAKPSAERGHVTVHGADQNPRDPLLWAHAPHPGEEAVIMPWSRQDRTWSRYWLVRAEDPYAPRQDRLGSR
jgi:hypothetical protein